MASLICTSNGYKTIQYNCPIDDSKRPKISLGKMTRKQALSIKIHVEQLIAACRTGFPVDPGTQEWVRAQNEFVIELPEHADHTQEAATITHICCKTMEQVTGAVPVGCEYALCYRWSKEAEAVFSDEGRLLPWGDPPEGQHTLS